MIWKNVKKLSILLIIILILVNSIIPAFATDTYEYNDFILYDNKNNNSNVSGGAFRSNNGTPLTSFNLYVDLDTGKWQITGGTFVNVPCPSGKVLSSSGWSSTSTKVVVGSQTIYAEPITMTNTYAFYNIPASPNYPTVSVYLPFETSSSPSIPNTPTLTIGYSTNGNAYLRWTPTGYTAKVLYSTDGSLYNVYQNYVNGDQTTIFLEESAYFRVQLYYNYNGETRLTDTSNLVQFNYDPSMPDDPEEQTIWDHLSTILDGLTDALKSVKEFLINAKLAVQELFAFLPAPVMVVFWACIIISLIFRLLFK